MKTPTSAMNVTIVTGPAIRRARSASTIRIVCVSDTHFYHQQLELPDGDILIHAGDFMGFGDMEWHIAEFNQWLGRQPHSHKIVIAGNHDSMFESSPGVARALLTNAIYLENSGVELEGLRFWGSPVQPTFHEWAFKVDRGDPIRRYWDMIPAGTDELVTHGPPFGILDRPEPSTPHLGCEELAKAVQRVKPRLHIFGHIHGGHGELRSAKGTHFVNASVLKKKYMHFNDPYVVDVVPCKQKYLTHRLTERNLLKTQTNQHPRSTILWLQAEKKCHWCGRVTLLCRNVQPDQATVDHLIPRGRGGPNVISNCVSACRKCNEDRNRMDRISPCQKGPGQKTSLADIVAALCEASRQRDAAIQQLNDQRVWNQRYVADLRIFLNQRSTANC